jgi:hypothetical protein
VSAPRPCSTCGMTIEFIEGPNGKAIPAQKIRRIYTLHEGKLDPLGLHVPLGRLDSTFYVSHFETCPQAGQHSRKG